MRTASRLKRLAVAGAILAAGATFQVAEAPAASASTYGTVKACQDINLLGTCQTFTGNTRDLTGSAVGNDQVSSVEVSAGTRVVLWEHADYTGRCHVIDTMSTTNGVPTRDMSLVGSVVGDEQVSSISFGYAAGCRNPTTSARLFSDGQQNGEDLYVDVRDLTRTAVGNDRATMIDVFGGPVALYTDINFEGTCVTFEPRGYRWALYNTQIREMRASSIAIGHRCSEDLRLCEHVDFGGLCISLTSNRSRLSATDLGNDAASSLRVPDGWKVTLYEHDDYKGLYQHVPPPVRLPPLIGDDWGNYETNFPVGVLRNDELSSIKVQPPSS